MGDIEDTPPPVKSARATVEAWEEHRGTSRREEPFKITDRITKRRLIFDMPIALHVVIWITVGGALVTGTTTANNWLSDRATRDKRVDDDIVSLARRQDATEAVIKDFQREVTPAIRSLTEQVSRLGGIIDAKNRLNSTQRGSGGIGE